MEKLENEVMKNENVEMAVATTNTVNIGELINNNSNTVCNQITNIQDMKKLFNLDSKVDCLLNDCVGELIRVKDVLIKKYLKKIEEPEVNENGEIVKEFSMSMSVVIVDDNEKSYATGSKTFGLQLIRYITMLNNMGQIKDGNFEPFEIKIIKAKVKGGQHEALSFELV